jgi:hypothetical protein
MRVIEARLRIQTLRTRWLRSSSVSVTLTGSSPSPINLLSSSPLRVHGQFCGDFDKLIGV